MKVVVVTQYHFSLWNAPQSFMDSLRREFPDIEFIYRNDYDNIEQYIADADIIIAASLRPEQFRTAKKLRWIYSTAAAVHQLLFPKLVNSDVILTNASEVHGHCVAQHVMALIFVAARRIDVDVRYQQKRYWGQEDLWQQRPRPRESGWRDARFSWGWGDWSRRRADGVGSRHACDRRQRTPAARS